MINQDEILEIVLRQLGNFWPKTNRNIIEASLPDALRAMELNFKGIPSNRFFDGKDIVFSPYFSIHWMIFLYRLSNAIYRNSIISSIDGCPPPQECDQLYYLNKIMHANDWFYAVELPVHFFAEHSIGSVLGRATYGDYLLVYQGTTIGGSIKNGKTYYPNLGDNIILFSNSSILGKCNIGSNVIISADTQVLNEDVPDDCIVFGKTPNLILKRRNKNSIKLNRFEYWW